MGDFGRQTPTNSVVLPYEKTRGDSAIELYRETGRTPQEWQEAIIYDILALNDDDLFVHTKFGYSVPRRNGKGEILTMRELDALFNGEKVLHTAHRTTTSSSASLRLATLLKEMGLEEVQRVRNGEVYQNQYAYSKQFGLERITLLETGGVVDFRTRTSKGGLGEGFDLLVIDEAQEYTDDQQSSLQYVVSDSDNPQIILCGTPPTTVSSGTVFQKLRRSCLAGETEEIGWAEWSVPVMSDVNDVSLWYETNPAMGHQLNERKVKAEDKTDEIDFNIQRLGLWLEYNQKSAISKKEWSDLCLDEAPELQKSVHVGVKYSHDGDSVAMSVAVKTKDGKVFVECLDCQSIRNGNGWILEWVKWIQPKTIIIDGANGQKILADDLADVGIKKGIVLPTVKDVVKANARFEQGVYEDVIRHCDQPSLEQAVSNCEKRAIGSNGGFGYKAIKEGVEIALLDSVILAFSSCVEEKERKKQTLNY